MRSLAIVFTCLCILAGPGDAQTPPAPTPAKPPQADAAKPAETSAAKPEEKKLPPEAIEQIVAPIALYADPLLSQTLMASTYPLEVVEAARWVKANTKLKGDALAKALEAEDWDPSVKSLVAAPQVLEMMDAKLDWMQQLGNAFLAQKADVMDAVQKLRQKAIDTGNLKSTKEQEVKTEGTTIIVEPADPQVIYVPTYDTTVVYGTWPYAAYPPYYYYPPYYHGGYAFASFAVGVAWGYAWGSCNWGGDDIDIDIDRNTTINNNIDRDKYKQQMQDRGTKGGKGSWQHDPAHRKGAGYGDAATAKKYDRGRSPSASSRDSYRGRGTGDGAARATTRDSSRASTSSGTRSGTSSSTSRASSGKKSSSSSAFRGSGSGSSTRAQSARGQTSRASSGSRGGGGRGGGGGGRGGGRGR